MKGAHCSSGSFYPPYVRTFERMTNPKMFTEKKQYTTRTAFKIVWVDLHTNIQIQIHKLGREKAVRCCSS